MRPYEIVAVFPPDLEEDALNTAIDRIRQRITEHGGAVTTTDRWGKRRLAYPIRKHRDGFYVLTVFTLETERVAGLRQTLGLHEELLRFVVASHHPAPAPAAGTAAPAAAASVPASHASASAHAPSAPAPAPAPASIGATPAASPAPASGAPSAGPRGGDV